MAQNKALAANKIGLLGSIFMGIAGTAPAFSIEVTTSTLLAAVGVFAPMSILYCGLIMLGIVFAFIHLNKVFPSAGTSYTWVSKIFGKKIGFLAGWAILASVGIFMVSGTVPISNATLLLLAPDYVNNVPMVAAVSAFWLTAVSLVVVKGIKASSYVQTAITAFEMVIMALLFIVGVYKFMYAPVEIPNTTWILPTDFSTSMFVSGALVAIFFYWGWDVILNLSEESKDKEHLPGTALGVAISVLIITFIAFTFLSLIALTPEEITQYNTNILFILSKKIFGSVFGYVAVVVVLLSTLGTIETGLLQFTRTLFAKSRDGVLHGRYATIHQKWQTPWVATVVLWLLGILLIVASSFVPSINNLLSLSISAIGFLICFYLSLTGFACAYYFKDKYRCTLKTFLASLTHFYYPLASASFLTFIGIYSFVNFEWNTKIVALLALLSGIIPMIIHRKNHLS